jgi:hypothetical protein
MDGMPGSRRNSGRESEPVLIDFFKHFLTGDPGYGKPLVGNGPENVDSGRLI